MGRAENSMLAPFAETLRVKGGASRGKMAALPDEGSRDAPAAARGMEEERVLAIT